LWGTSGPEARLSRSPCQTKDGVRGIPPVAIPQLGVRTGIALCQTLILNEAALCDNQYWHDASQWFMVE